MKQRGSDRYNYVDVPASDAHARRLESNRKWRLKNPQKCKEYARRNYLHRKEKWNENQVFYRYGITRKQLESLRERQLNKCAICKKEFGTDKHTKPCVDHGHSKNLVRALLCRRCNLGLGFFLDSPEFLRFAADYLEGFQ